MHRPIRPTASSPLLRASFAACAAAVGLAGTSAFGQGIPPGFVAETIETGWTEIAGVAPIADGRMIAWERNGRIFMIDPASSKGPQLMLDLSQEVGGWRDYGLLSVLPDRKYLENGRLYLLYVVDRHHLLFFGTPQYSPTTDAYFAATIGRITRYTATAASGFTDIDPASRAVLLGEDKTTGIPIVHQSHGVGSLLWGDDGTLLVTTGDTASYLEVDLGGQVADGYVDQALADGILKPKENVGSFRSQLIDCLDGKVLRLDPDTGDGVPSNPWYDPLKPRDPKSRVWCIGLRNPFRTKFEPGTGSSDPAAGDPGTLLIGDVGWNWYEEWSRAETGGLNFGWPLFEGLEYHPDYARSDVVNLDAPNPLAGTAGCTEPFLRFRSLVRQDSQQSPPIVNPCAVRQAESAAVVGAILQTTHPGYTGNGYIDYQAPSNESIAWTITVPTGGTWTLGFRYAMNGPKPTMKLSVGATTISSGFVFDTTGSWTEWRVRETNVTLAAGTHTITLASQGSSGPNVDGLMVYQPGQMPVLTGVPTFAHARPRIEWSHGGLGGARLPSFANGAASAVPMSSSIGQNFSGSCAISGPKLDFPSWPTSWRNRYLIADFSTGMLRGVRLDGAGAVTSVEIFGLLQGNLVDVVAQPADDSLWLVRWPSQLARIRWTICSTDFNADGQVNANDLAVLLGQWGQSAASADVDGSGVVDGGDLAILLGSWGPCTN
jgi:glucose/arabinose dehydrogenase